MQDEDFPDGLGHPHLSAPPPIVRHASPLSLLILGTLLAVALSGALGGGEPPVLRAEDSAAVLEVTTPTVLRNGEFFEMTVAMTATQAVEDLTLGVAPSLWMDMTQNSMIPAAAEENFSDGLFRYSYGPAAAGDRVEVKMDFQINPALLGNRQGLMAIFDGDVPLARLPVEIEVRP